MSGDIRVLVVEDEEIAAAAHAEYVRRLPGFELIGVARAGAEALNLLKERQLAAEPVDLVLLDMNLPDLHGLDVVRRIRGAGLPTDVIAITAVRDLQVVRSAISAGIAQYLIKPFSFAAFRDKLESYRSYRISLPQHASAITQSEVDRTLAALRPAVASALPKGLQPETLERISAALRDSPVPVSAAALADGLLMSRVTARRYLEYLADQQLATRTPRYGTRGRPEFEYGWRRR